MADSEEFDGEVTSTIKVTFHDGSHRRLAARYWSFWLSQQANPKTARALDIEKASSSGMMEVQSKTFDRISFKWNGKTGAKLMVRFNCLSTDFSRIKGVKGIPLRVHMDTLLEGTGGDHNNSSDPDSPLMERSFAKIKLFRDKGAERKNKDDHKHLEKMWDKMRGKNADTNPLVSMLAPVRCVSEFTECFDHPEGSDEEETRDLSETLRTGNSVDTSARLEVEAYGNQQGAEVAPPPVATPVNRKRRRGPEGGNTTNTTNSGTPVQTGDGTGVTIADPFHYRHNPHHANQFSHGAGSSPSSTPSPSAVAVMGNNSSGAPPGPPPMALMNQHNPDMFLDRDPTYVPQHQRKKRPVCTVQDLTQKLSEKLEIQSTTISAVYRKTTKKELMVRVDDAMVGQMSDELDMIVDYDFNQRDGSVNLTLKY
ncbi:grainyhead-like [Lunasporangiospora selenospora]|uniref:Grainyhead-like n=1 Tax=Lunasporangiospora selenospora TaxID=979761 RepID=A0A9P6KBS8_9FUNG|nr:grainyhead-like [Lunasporangiospora selenospora]